MNPIFIRFCRSNLRMKKALFWYLLTLIVTAFSVAIIYAPLIARDADPVDAARRSLMPILIIQGIIMIFMGTGSVASGITREKVDNVLNYQRLTPLPIRQKLLGYLFGLPVREYVLFAITLPFLAFTLIVGKVPPSAFLPYYLIFFTSTILYHLTGMVAGMISKRWRLSARISQGLIILLYFVLPQLSHLGLVFLEFLTVRPVFAEKMMPVIGESMRIDSGGIGLLAGQSVPFFHLQISGTLFSFIIQAGLIVLFAGIVARKWKADSYPAISKTMALSTFGVFTLLSLANIWPNLTRSDNALQILQSDGNIMAELAVSFLPLILALTTTFLAFALLTSAAPDPLQFRQGKIRAERLNLGQLSCRDDAATAYPLTLIFFGIQVVLMLVVFHTLNRAGYFESISSQPLAGAWLVVAMGLSLFYFQGLKESFGTGKLALFILLSWALPLLAAVLIIAVNQGYGKQALYVSALSPLTLIPLSAAMLVPEENFQGMLPTVQRALGLAILVVTSLNIWLHVRLRLVRARASRKK